MNTETENDDIEPFDPPPEGVKMGLAIIQGTLLTRGAQRLLRCILRRFLSIGWEDCVHMNCFPGRLRRLPTKKRERLAVMGPHRIRVAEFIKANRPCAIVGMGRLACETLTGESVLGSRAGTSWRTDEFGIVWIADSPESALYDAGLSVGIVRVLRKAAEMAGIRWEFDRSVPMFNWEPYEMFKLTAMGERKRKHEYP